MARHVFDLQAAPSAASDRYWPVSVKGAVLHFGRVLLAYNERGEWELPGGRLESGETLTDCVEREVLEETSLTVKASRLLDSCVYEVVPGKHVVLISYQCQALDPDQAPATSREHAEVAFIALGDLDTISIPRPYRRAIAIAASGPTTTLGV